MNANARKGEFESIAFRTFILISKILSNLLPKSSHGTYTYTYP